MGKLTVFLDKLETTKKTEWMVQFIKFGFVGITNTIISYGVYALLIWLDIHYFVASIMAFIISVAWSFLLNNRFVFQISEHRIWWKTLIKTYASYALTGLVLNNILLYIWISLLGMDKYLVYLINIIITVPLNFMLNKFWAFRKVNK